MGTDSGSPAPAGVSPPEGGHLRLQSRGLRWVLVASGVLVLLAGIQLFVFTERTDEYFAWTIVPPVGAAFLGAGYFAAVAMEWLAVRERLWTSARLVSVTILVFAVLTAVVTFVHIDRFHLDGPTTGAVAVTWGWILIYVTVPPLMVACLVAQRGMPGADPPRVAPLPTWFKVVFGFHALVMLVVGAFMFLWPVATGDALWPWELTPLTGRAIAAWLLGLGFGGLGAMWENDWLRLRPMLVSFVLLVGFQLAALARYAGTLEWDRARTWIYLVYLLDMLVLALVAHRETRLAARTTAPA